VLVLAMIRMAMAEARVVVAKVVLTVRMAKARSGGLLERRMEPWKVLRRDVPGGGT
jgi:hypothetical protein